MDRSFPVVPGADGEQTRRLVHDDDVFVFIQDGQTSGLMLFGGTMPFVQRIQLASAFLWPIDGVQLFGKTATAGRDRLGRFSEQEPVLGGDIRRNHLSENPVAGGSKLSNPGGIDSQRAVHPPLQATAIGHSKVMATGKHRDPGAGIYGLPENQIRQAAASMS